MAKFQTLHDVVNGRIIFTYATADGYQTDVHQLTEEGSMGHWLARHEINKPEYAIKVHQACIEEAKPNNAPPLTCVYCGEAHYGVKMQKLYDVPMCWHCFSVRVG